MVYILFPLFKNTFDTNRKVFIYVAITIMILTFGNTLVNHGINTIKFLAGIPLAPSKNYFGIFNPFYKINGWAFSYFCLGGIIYHYKNKILQIPLKARNILSGVGLPISCFGLFVLGLIMSSSTALSWSWDVVFNGFDSIFTLLNVLFVFLLFLNYKSNNHFITTISRNTLGIYFIHMIFIKLTRPALQQLNCLCNLPCSLIYTFLILCASLGISLLIQKIPIIKKIL